MLETYCIFSANYLPNTGGVESYTQNLAKALAEMGNHVIIVTMNVFGLAQHEFLEEGIEIVRLPCYKALKGRYPIPRRNQLYKSELRSLEGRDIDFIVINTRFYPHSFTGMKLAVQKAIVPIVIDHGSAHLTMGNKVIDIFVSAFEHVLTRSILRYPADYYAVSQAGVEWLCHFGIQAQGVLNNSIDAGRFRESSSHRDFKNELMLNGDSFVVVFVGRLIPEKGIKQLVESAKLLINNPTVQFVVAGDGPLQKYICDTNLPNIHLTGRLNSTDIAALYKMADVNCLPSRSEGFATTLLEAAACGVPSVVTRIGGVDELMPGEGYGMVLNHSDSREIVDAILFLYENPSINKLLGDNVKQRVESDFSWGKTAEKLKKACTLANSNR